MNDEKSKADAARVSVAAAASTATVAESGAQAAWLAQVANLRTRAEAAEAAIAWVKFERDDAIDREQLAIAEWHRARDERDALAPRVRDGWDEEHAVLRRELDHVRKDRDALRTRLTATFKALTGEP